MRLKFQVIPSGRARHIRLRSGSDQAPLREIDWQQVLIPSSFQEEGSCVFHSTCQWLATMLRFYFGREVIPQGCHFDAQKMYWQNRKEQYGDQSDEGSQLNDGFNFMIRHGIIPESCVVKEINPTLEDIADALYETPLVAGGLADTNWEADQVNRENGGIPFKRVDQSSALGYHSILLVGFRKQQDCNTLPLQNWWPRWGWHGTGLLSWENYSEFTRWLGDGPYTIANPDLLLTDTAKEWRNWLVK